MIMSLYILQGIEVFKDAVFPTRSLRRELNEVTRQLQLMEEKMERMTHNLQNAPPVSPPHEYNDNEYLS